MFVGLMLTAGIQATQTTYLFTSKAWASKVGTVTTDGKTDGWVSDKEGADYSTGRQAPLGLTSQGVQVTQGFSNAGATSVLSFTEVRKVVFNYCTNNKKGKGTIHLQVGENTEETVSITAPNDNGGVTRDIEIALPTTQTGKLKFWVTCTENSIYINTITIKATDGSPNISGLTADIYQLVTSTNDLQDGDDIIFGVSGTTQNYIMGLYDEGNSKNNVHAIRGTYSSDRQSVNENAEAVYTLLKGEKENGDPYYAFADAYGDFLVASGGNPNKSNNNYLTIWDTIYSQNYGWYGAWDITIAANGEAEIVNLGSSRSGKLQFNPNGGTPIFSCYQDWSQTKPVIFRRVTIDNPTAPYIKAPLCNFGTVLLEDGAASGSKTIEVNAINLTEDISATLTDGSVFSLDKSVLDRDGDKLTIRYAVSGLGEYRDTLVLKNADTEVRVSVLLSADHLLTIAEARQLSDLTQCYLKPVVITKKYDKYVFVQDETGSMLLFDSGNLYAKDRKNGDILTDVTGKFKNYYGNPDLNLTAAFTYKSGETILPTPQTTLPDSADVCRYISLQKVQYNASKNLVVDGKELKIYDLFNYQNNSTVVTGKDYTVEGIVYYYNGVTLCPTKIEVYTPTPTDDLLTIPQAVKRLENGEVMIYHAGRKTDMRGNDRR